MLITALIVVANDNGRKLTDSKVMPIDHIFIFSKQSGQEAEELVKFGLTEGSSRVHPGQGTTNRKFYFDNCFLEVLWVHDPTEIQSVRTSPTGLWERSVPITSGHSPFGLCLTNTEDTDVIFEQSQKYQPEYFSEGMTIDFINKEKELPWCFRLPFKDLKEGSSEPKEHPNNIQKLTKAIFGVTQSKTGTEHIEKIGRGIVEFRQTEKLMLTLEFDDCRSGQEHHFEGLPLIVKY